MHPKNYPELKLTSDGEPLSYPALLVPLDPARKMIGVGRTKLYELITAGHLNLVKIGSKSLITADSLQRFVAGLPTAERVVRS